MFAPASVYNLPDVQGLMILHFHAMGGCPDPELSRYLVSAYLR